MRISDWSSDVCSSDLDSLSLSLQGLRLLQDLTQFHLDDPDPAPLIALELQRLQFVYQKSQLPGKDSLYIQALYTLLDRTIDTPVHTDVAHALAGRLVENNLPYLSVPRGRKEIYDQERDDSLRYRSEEHTSELQSLMRISYAVFCLKKQ